MTAEEKPFNGQLINALADAVKADPARMQEFLAEVYPFLRWQARQVFSHESLHEADDLAGELLPWVGKKIGQYQPGMGATFTSFIWDSCRQRMRNLARRHGASMRRPWQRGTRYEPHFAPLDAPVFSDSAQTLGDSLTYEPGEPEHGAFAELPMHLLQPMDQAILHAHFVQGQGWTEIAKRYGCTKQNIHWRARAALRKLRAHYAEQNLRTFATAATATH